MTRCRQGLTWIELIASVTAVGVVAALLAPALADVRRRGKDTLCLQNLARIAQASIVYAAADAEEQAIPVHPQVYNPDISGSLRLTVARFAWGGKSGRGREGTDSFFWGTAKWKGPATRPLNKILYGNVFPDYRTNPGPGFANWRRDEQLGLPVYRCPSDNGYTGINSASWAASGLTGSDHYGTSYAANCLWIYVPGSQSPYSSNSPYLHRLSDVVNSVQTIYYLENCGRYAFWAEPQGQGCGGAQQGVVHGWHGLHWVFNTAFVDGHVEPVKMKGLQNPHLGRYPAGEYYYWHCVIIRGDNWQLDTLPLAPVESSIPVNPPRDGGQEGDDAERPRLAVPEIR
ncbi:MAG: hypothetical protein ACYSUI_09325 [Planctomycetota bacterium]|jgi:prepilin-type processing-associated H-X9-DG protein